MPRRVRCDVSAFDGREKEEEQNECVLPSRRSMSTSIFSLFLFSSLCLSSSLSHFSFLLPPPPPSSNRTFAYLSVSSLFLSFFLSSFALFLSPAHIESMTHTRFSMENLMRMRSLLLHSNFSFAKIPKERIDAIRRLFIVESFQFKQAKR